MGKCTKIVLRWTLYVGRFLSTIIIKRGHCVIDGDVKRITSNV